ncbi:MAG: TonB-dependent receptor [Bacteroidota bacterium]
MRLFSTLAGLALALLLAAPDALAQTGTITGRVTHAETGDLLPGASIRIDGTQLGAATDAFGKFNVRGVPAGAVTLVASFVGFETAEIATTAEAGETVYVEVVLAPNPDQIGEVVIRSEKFVRNLQDTQTSVAVVGMEQLEAIPVRDWEDATRQVGNVSTSGNGVFTIRGVPNTGVGGGSGPTAALYVDGVQQGRFGTFRTIRGAWDLEAIEVFRGPQSTLSGRNSLAGAIYLRSAAPSFEYGAAARVRGGSNEALEGAFMVTGPIIADQLAFRVSGESGTEDRDFTYVNVTSDDDDFATTTQLDQRNLKARLLFTPTALPGLSVLAGYTRAFDRPGVSNVTATPDDDGELDFSARENLGPFAFFEETTFDTANLEASYDLTPNLALTAQTGFTAMDYAIDGLRFQTNDPEVFRPVAQRSNTDETTFTQELRLNFETDRTRAVFGGYYGRFDTDRIRNDNGDVFFLARPQIEVLAGGPVPQFSILYDAVANDITETDNIAVFGEVNQEVIDGLTLTAGLRYDNESFTSRNDVEPATVTFEGTPPPLAPFEPTIAQLIIDAVAAEDEVSETTFDAWLPKVGVVYDLTPDMSLGATVQRGYRAGGVFFVLGGRLNEYDPEYTWNYELSYRSRWLGGRLIANANVFYTDWRDQQVSVPIEDAPTFFETINAGASTLYGGELELRAIPARGLTLYGSLGLTESQFDEFVRPENVRDQRNGELVLVERDLAGLQFPGAPETTVAVGAIFDPGSGPFGALNVNYVGENFTNVGSLPSDQEIIENPAAATDEPGVVRLGDLDNDPRLRAGDYVSVDAQLGYTLGLQGTEVRVTGFARNLLDIVATDRRFINIQGGVDGQIIQPRVIGLSLDVEI